MYKNMKRIASIVLLISFLFSNFNLQSFSQTLSTSLNVTVQRDNSGVYKITKNSISIIWNAIEDAVSYEVYAASSNSQVDFQTVSENIIPTMAITLLSVVYTTYDSVILSWQPITIAGVQPPTVDRSIFYEVNFAVYQDGMDITNPENLDIAGFQKIILSDYQVDQSGKIVFRVSSLLPNTRYVFFVRAVRKIDSSTYYSLPSNVVMATTLIKYEVPLPSTVPVVENLSVVTTTYNSALLSWSYVENVYFEIQVSEDIKNANAWQVASDSFKPSIKEVDYTTGLCYFTVQNLKPDTLYYFRVRAYIIKDNQKVYSEFSSPVFARTQKVPPPKTPVAFGIKDYGKDYAIFVWEIAETGRRYVIEIADNISFSNSKKYTTDTDATEYKVTGLKPNTRYWARLFAMASDSQLSQSTEIISFVTKKDVSEYTGVFDTVQDTTPPFITVEDSVSGRMIIEITYRYVNESLDSKPVLIDFTKRTSSSIFQFVIKIRYDVLKALVKLNKDFIVTLDGATSQFNFAAIDSSDIDKLTVSGVSPSSIYTELTFIRASGKYNVKDAISEVYDIRYTASSLTKQVGISYFPMPIKISLVNREPWSVAIPYVFDLTSLSWKEPENAEFASDNKSVTFNLQTPQATVIVRKSFYRDIISSSYATKLYNLFKTIASDDTSDTIGIKSAVSKQELASFLVYFAEKKRLYRFEIIDDYVKKAYKAGIIENTQDNSILTKEAAVDMVVRFYEIYTGNEILADDVTWTKLSADSKYILSLKKAYKMGWLFDYVTFNPKETATREYVLAFFYHVVSSM
ncbi:fibronectin type III domain-containing protein [Caldicellulosiruptor acetigenus]|uniref:Fibronectin type III domain protein n=1 Tax=Caldicellulosiruptor acetigenus 6A TaxID=632516 RepID=G2PZG5_9FIRM|nr:fibronectin type III domain-containing protein [Caldicellulosiruptor acetigenus]AEM74183.1 Fibronectin type III domain protein [Caldicellulosiruptor acetigenus 6A]